MTRPRAADDFAAIRTRLEELRRERENVPNAEEQERLLPGPRPHPAGTARASGLSPTPQASARVRTP
jgi:hypothetical protein